MNSSVISKAISEGRYLLLEPEAKSLCKEYLMTVTRFETSTTAESAARSAREIGFPVALKVVSPQVIHKSDVGGVALDLKDEDQVKEAFWHIQDHVKKYIPTAEIKGVIVEEMVKPATELIIGMKRDIQFGPCVMFGLGGIFVELLGDVAFRVCPVTESDASEMIREIKAYPVLKGYRGVKPVNEDSVIQVIVNVSKIALENPEILEIDLNPVVADPNGAVVVDARMILADT